MKDKNNVDTGAVQIVIAEDSPTQAEQLKYLLEKHNYRAIVARDGKEAFNLVKELKPSLVISDVIMPEMDGYELCKEIKSDEGTMDIPVILLTALTRSEEVLEGISCGADNFITKPYNEDYLISHIEQILVNRKIYKNERVRVGVEIVFGGKRRFITATQQQMLTLLISTYEAAVQRNDELVQVQEELKVLNEHLEDIVTERTAELAAEIGIRTSAEERVNKLNRVYVVLSNINQAIVRAHDITQLFEDVCKIAVVDGKFQSAWIGIVNNEKKKIETFASIGIANGLAEMDIDQNPVTGVIKSGKHFISNNIIVDSSLPEIWKQHALSLGFGSFAVFPLIVLEKAKYSFCIYSNEFDFFDKQEIKLLDEMSGDISFALEYIQNEIERKKYQVELIQAKEKAEGSDRLKTAFLHNISHEIRTPMNAIIGFSEFLSDPELSFEKRQNFIDIISQSCDQLLNVITDIISIATIEAGQEKVHEKEIKLNSTLKLLFENFLLKIKKENVCLSMKLFIPNDEYKIITDETKLIQIITNLICNAIKFTKQGHVNFGYVLKDTEFEFFVEDTGIGIPPEMHEEIFQRFRQVESDTMRQFGGSGLGLSISKAYVELFGGKIWLVSELNLGSTFYFTIPYKTVKKESFFDQQFTYNSTINSIESKTLLIAEDEDSNYSLLEEVLSDQNITLLRAINGAEAVETCKTTPVDMVLMDLKMPVMDGFEATRQIRIFMPNLPIIVQTAYNADLDKNKALACGCNDFLSKPIRKDLLISRIKEQFSKV